LAFAANTTPAADVASTEAPRAADQVIQGNNYVAIIGGYVWPAKSLGTTGAGGTLSGIFGHEFAPHASFEVNLQTSTFETGVNSGTNFYKYGFTADLVYSLWDRKAEKPVTPFALIGAGAVQDDFHPFDHVTAYLLETGVGAVSKPLYDGMRLRLDARYVRDSKDGGHAEPRLMAGIEIPLGRTVRQVEYLPGKTEYITREVVAPPPPPPPVIDSDGDGVDDAHDLCPNTPRGMKVDEHGCVVAQTFELMGVNFEFNQSRLTPNAQAILAPVGLAFIAQPTLRVEIAGHTDSIGSDTSNIVLSQRRAEAVRGYLISKGAAPRQLFAHGYGKSELLVPQEQNDADRERNRRVELRVLTP
jgi:OOP family OmpA-OmpF porin